jgi:hypothetical protein
MNAPDILLSEKTGYQTIAIVGFQLNKLKMWSYMHGKNSRKYT